MNGLSEHSGGVASLSQSRAAPTDSDNRRPAGQLALSVFSMLVASAAGLALVGAATSGFLCSTIAVPRGANITTAGGIAVLGGFAGLIASIAVRNRPRLLSAVLLGEAATLGVAIGFVARDAATATVTQDCGLFESDISTSTSHVEYAYVLLGLAIVLLIAQALRGFGRSPRNAARAIVAVAALALLVAVLPAWGSSSGSSRVFGSVGTLPTRVTSSANGLPGSARVETMFKGIRQRGMVLGSPRAPVTLVAYIELQCPFCRQFETGVLPGIVKRYVATGKVKIVARPLAFLGADSIRGRNAMIAAGIQNKAFNFAELLYLNQGAENSGWLTNRMVARLAKSIPGLNPRRLFAVRSGVVTKQAEQLDQEGSRIDGTPTLFVGRSGRKGKETPADTRTLVRAIRAALGARSG